MSITNQIKRKTGNLAAILHYPFILRQLEKHDLIFFFPFWQTGGGERVHADILNVFRALNPLCFLTDNSENNGFRADFERAAKVIPLNRWALKKSFIAIMQKAIARKVNKKKSPVIFGCHSEFFYTLIPLIHPHVKIIDLTHAFTFNPFGPENYSLPFVERIDHRVVLGDNAKNDYRDLYRRTGVPEEYLTRLVTIPNKVEIPPKRTQKRRDFPLKVLFVSRNAPEKRPEIFIKIAQLSHEKKLPLEFILIGKFEEYAAKVTENTKIVGEVFDKKILNDFYAKSDLILVTSWREGFPMVILEGMCFGVVPITTDVGEIPSYISFRERKNGFLIKGTSDINTIANDFIDTLILLIKNEDLLEETSRNCYDFVKEFFNPDKFHNAYWNLFFTEK